MCAKSSPSRFHANKSLKMANVAAPIAAAENLHVKPMEIAEITNVLNGLMVCMDTGKSKKFASFFYDSPNSSVTIKIAGKTASGREDIGKLCDGLYQKFCIGDSPCKHWEGNVFLEKVLSLQGEVVIENTSYWKSIQGGEIMSTGLHRDTFKQSKENSRWYLLNRTIEHVWTKGSGFVSSTGE